jgi:hypothetical protein
VRSRGTFTWIKLIVPKVCNLNSMRFIEKNIARFQTAVDQSEAVQKLHPNHNSCNWNRSRCQCTEPGSPDEEIDIVSDLSCCLRRTVQMRARQCKSDQRGRDARESGVILWSFVSGQDQNFAERGKIAVSSF